MLITQDALGDVATIAAARDLAHALVEPLTRAARANLPPRDDDSHSNLAWSVDDQACLTHPMGPGAGLLAGLAFQPLRLVLTDGGAPAAAYSLPGRRLSEAAAWLEARLPEHGLRNGRDVALPYALPEGTARFCQTHANRSQLGQLHCPLVREQTAPCVESGVAVEFDARSAGRAAARVEVVGDGGVDGGVDGGERLQTSHAPQAEHRPLPSSEWQVCILSSIVEPASRLLAKSGTNLLQRSAVASELVGHDRLGFPVLTHCILEKFQSGLRVTGSGDEAFEHLALVIDGASQGVHPAVELHQHLVEMPSPAARSHALDPTSPDLGSKCRAEPVPPEPHGLMADIATALMPQVFHVPLRQREPHVEHNCQADDFGTGLEVPER